MARSLTEVSNMSYAQSTSKLRPVSRLYAHSKNYDMDLTLDYNVELFPLENNQTFALALASSLARGPPTTNDAGEEEKDTDVWRPDGKGRRGLEEDYDYVMYGKVCVVEFIMIHTAAENCEGLPIRGIRDCVRQRSCGYTRSSSESQTEQHMPRLVVF